MKPRTRPGNALALDTRVNDFESSRHILLRRASDIDALHDLRVSIRALRAALRALGKRVPKGRRRGLDASLKRIFAATSALRDRDVLAGLERRLRVDARLGAADRSSLRRTLRSKRTQRLPAELTRVFDQALPLGALGKGRREVRRRARRDRRKLRARVRSAVSDERCASPRRLHRIRVELKWVRYVAETLAPLLPREAERIIPALRKAQTALGSYHDMEVLLTRVDSNPVARARIRREREKLRRAAVRCLSALDKKL